MLHFVFLNLILIESVHTQIFPDLYQYIFPYFYQYIPDIYQLYKKKLSSYFCVEVITSWIRLCTCAPREFQYLTLLWAVIKDVLVGNKASSARSWIEEAFYCKWIILIFIMRFLQDFQARESYSLQRQESKLFLFPGRASSEQHCRGSVCRFFSLNRVHTDILLSSLRVSLSLILLHFRPWNVVSLWNSTSIVIP